MLCGVARDQGDERECRVLCVGYSNDISSGGVSLNRDGIVVGFSPVLLPNYRGRIQARTGLQVEKWKMRREEFSNIEKEI